MRLFASLLAITVPFHGCQTPGVSPPSDVASAPALGSAVNDKNSKISANAEAAELANLANPDGLPKQAAAGAISVVRSLAGPANPDDRSAALSLVNQAMKGQLKEAQEGWIASRQGANALLARIDSLEEQVAAERVKASVDLQSRINEADSAANASRKKWLTLIFFGFGAIGTAGGVVMLILQANPAVAASYAFLGPKAGFCALGAGITLIATGIAVNAIERLIEAHPYVFAGMVSAALALIGVSATLVWSNHMHHVSK